jgi:hypothetical protein
MKHFKWGASYERLGTYGMVSEYRLDDRGSIPAEESVFLQPLCPD